MCVGWPGGGGGVVVCGKEGRSVGDRKWCTADEWGLGRMAARIGSGAWLELLVRGGGGRGKGREGGLGDSEVDSLLKPFARQTPLLASLQLLSRHLAPVLPLTHRISYACASQDLQLTSCKRVGPKTMDSLASHAKLITRLNLCELFDVTDEALLRLATNCKRIECVPNLLELMSPPPPAPLPQYRVALLRLL